MNQISKAIFLYNKISTNGSIYELANPVLYKRTMFSIIVWHCIIPCQGWGVSKYSRRKEQDRNKGIKGQWRLAKKTPGSKEYTTVNRFYTSGFEDGISFDTLVNSKKEERYNVGKIENKIVNADGV